MSTLARVHANFAKLDKQLKELIAELDSDPGEAGSAYRHYQKLLEEWRSACTAVRNAIQDEREGIGAFSMSRRRTDTVDVEKACAWLRRNNLYDQMVDDGAITSTTTVTVDKGALEALLGEDYEELKKEAVTTKIAIVIKGPKPEDVV